MKAYIRSGVLPLALFSCLFLVGCPEATPPTQGPEAAPIAVDFTSDVSPIDGPATSDIVMEVNGQIYAISDKATDFRRITKASGIHSDPIGSSDGKRVYFSCVEGICSVKSDGSDFRVLTQLPRMSAFDLSLSPDGTRMLFAADDGENDIYVLALSSGVVTQLTDDAVSDISPDWTPTGGLVWSRDAGKGNFEVLVASPGQVRTAARSAKGAGLVGTAIASGIHPDVSPDGSKVAYQGGPGPDDIYVVNLDGTGNTALTITPFPDRHPSWSPDGTKIAYARGNQVSPGNPSEADGFEQLYTINPDGSGVRLMTDVDAHIRTPEWTSLVRMASILPPDCADEDPQCVHSVDEGDSGNTPMTFRVKLTERPASPLTVNFRVVAGSAATPADYTPPASGAVQFATNEVTKDIVVQVVGDTVDEPDESFYVELLPSTGVELGVAKRQGVITDDDEPPSPSPSPTVGPTGPGAIAYQVASGEVWVMKPDGSDQHKLVDGAAPDWKHDGTQVAFFDQASANPDIFQIPPAGGTPTRVNGTSSFDGSPSWAPDGSGISWTNLGAGAPDIYKAEPPTGTPTPVVATAASEYNQDWDVLHDGTEVMAVVKDGAIILVNPDTGAEISLIDPDNGGQIGPVLVPASESANNPAISPDGTKLAYNSSLHQDPDIYVLDLTTAGATAAHLTTSSAEDVAPTWSPDGTMLAFASNRNGAAPPADCCDDFEIYTMNAATGAGQTNITNAPGDQVEPAWGPAGTAAVISAVTGAVDEPSSEQMEPSSVVPSHGGRPSPSSSDTERGVRVAIPGLMLGSWLLGRRRKDQ